MFEGYKDQYDASARLCILRALHEQNDNRLSESMITTVLQAFAINKGRDYVVNQLKWLADEAGAIKLREVGDTYIAELTQTGEDHVERRRALHGIKKPSAARS